MISVRICTLELERLTYEKEQKIYIKLLIFIISLYAIFTLISQQNTLNQYSKKIVKNYHKKIEKEKQEKRRTC